MMTNLSIVVLCLCVYCNSVARIRNGYDLHIDDRRIALENLKLKLAEGTALTSAERHSISRQISKLTNYIAYYELTEVIIDQLRTIAPDIYASADYIKDRKGRFTDIYIKLIPKEESILPLSGASFLGTSARDEDASYSSYGEYSVAIDVWISGTALLQLCHELGHVNYIVPNLAAYSKFYERHYPKEKANVNSIGHHRNDLSGRSAIDFEKTFRSDYSRYIRHIDGKPETVFSLLKGIRRDIRERNSLVNPATASNLQLWK